MLVHVSDVKFNGQSTVSAPLRALMRSIGAASESDGGDANEKSEDSKGTAPQVSVLVLLRNTAMSFLYSSCAASVYLLSLEQKYKH
jgi:hypothetical protein